MIDPTGFLAESAADERGELDMHRLTLIGGMALIAGLLAVELFGTGVVARLSAEDPGVDAFGAELATVASEIGTR